MTKLTSISVWNQGCADIYMQAMDLSKLKSLSLKREKIRMPFICHLPVVVIIFVLLSFLNGLSYELGLVAFERKFDVVWKSHQFYLDSCNFEAAMYS